VLNQFVLFEILSHYPSFLRFVLALYTCSSNNAFRECPQIVAKPQVPMKKHETIVQYPERNPEEAVTMNFSISKHYSPQIPQNEKFHRRRRLNLAKIKGIYDHHA